MVSDLSGNAALKSLPLVTVIIAAYNYAHLIGETLESVIAQTYANWECIVVDDGSADDTREVVESYIRRDNRIRYVHQLNKCAAAARNNGMRHSNGTYLQFLDADDLIEPRKLERQVEYLETHGEVDVVYGAVMSFDGDKAFDSKTSLGDEASWVPQISGSGKEALMALIKRPLLIHAPLVKMGLGDSTIWFDERLKANEDWFYWVQSALRGRYFKYARIEGTLGFYRQHNRSACKNRPLIDSETRQLRKRLKSIIKDPEARRLNQRSAAEYEGDLGVDEVMNGNVVKGIWQLIKAGVLSPTLREKMKWFFCAGIAPFAPKEEFHKSIASPAADSIASVARYRFGRVS